MSLNLANYLAQGYSVEEILNFVAKTFPNIGKAIKSNAKSGISANEILKLISALDARQLKKADENAERMNFDNPLERANDAAKSQEGNPLLQAAKFGGGALVGAAALRAAPMLAQQFLGQKGVQQQASAQIPPTPYQSTIQPSLQEAQAVPIEQPGVATSLAGIQQLQQTSSPQQQPKLPVPIHTSIPQPKTVSSNIPPIVDSESIIKQMGLEDKIENLFQAKNPISKIPDIVETTLAPSQKKWYNEQVKAQGLPPVKQLVQDYLNNRPAIKKMMDFEEKVAPGGEAISEKPSEPLQKGSIIATPEGIVGEVQKIGKTDALVKDDSGKLHKTKIEDVIEPPMPIKDIAELQSELIAGIEKETGEHVSRNVNWAGYDPATNELAYLPWDGALYIYENISDEDRAMLEKFMTQRKTTGENFIGAWEKGSKSPIGAGMSALIKKLQAQRGGKGKEYSKKFPTIYNALEPSIKAAKAKLRKKK